MKYLLNMIVEFLEVAEIEIDEAYQYYEKEQKNLALRFIYEIQNTVERIKLFPKGWQSLGKNTRRALTKSFPYGIIYQIKDDSILIIAIAHLNKKPKY